MALSVFHEIFGPHLFCTVHRTISVIVVLALHELTIQHDEDNILTSILTDSSISTIKFRFRSFCMIFQISKCVTKTKRTRLHISCYIYLLPVFPLTVFPLGRFFSANQQFVGARANYFWQYSKHTVALENLTNFWQQDIWYTLVLDWYQIEGT